MGRMTKYRAILLLVIVGMILALYGVKLYSMQVAAADVNGDNITTYTITTRVRAARGEILDKNGNKLVTNRASYDLHINHYVIQGADDTNEQLLKLAQLCVEMGVEYTDNFPVTTTQPFAYTLDEQNSTWRSYYQTFLKSRGNIDSDVSASTLIQMLRSSYVIPEDWTDEEARLVIGLRYELTLRNITNLSTYILVEDASDEFLSAVLALDVPGMMVEASSVREYTTEYAAHILGYIGAMSADQWAEYKSIDGYEMDSLIGQSGLEQAYEKYLHGVDGIRVDTVTQDGVVVNSYYKVEPVAGQNVEISIDISLQEAAEDKLAEVIAARQELGIDAEGGAVVAIDVKTGQVLVCGSYPTYDLATMFDNWEELNTDSTKPLLNRALTSTYAPGSTYKVAMLIASMEAGIVDADEEYYDTGYFSITGYTAHCSNNTAHGTVTAATALQKSCNCYFCNLANRIWESEDLDWSVVDEIAQNLGLGEETGVELYEKTGYRANPTSKALFYAGTYDETWRLTDQLQASFGQSVHSYTPIQLAVYASTLANQGTRYQATFLHRVIASDYTSLIYENQAVMLSQFEMSEDTIATYLEGMIKVAHEEGGTAYSTFRNYSVDGVSIKVAAKTGTAEGVGTSNGAFICFAPADDPQIAIAVYGEHVKGGSYLAPVAKAILDVYFSTSTGDVTIYENQLG